MTKQLDTEKPPVLSTNGLAALPVSPDKELPAVTVPESVKRLLPPGAFRTDDHQYYFNGEGPYPGTTSVIDVLQKWALTSWKQREAARAMYDMLVAAEPLTEYPSNLPRAEHEKQMIQAAIEQADEQRDKAATVGSGVHLLADLQVKEEAGIPLTASESAQKPLVTPGEWEPYLQAYRGFLQRYSASSIVSSEKMIWSANGYGGTYDLLMLIDNELWLLDIKTSKGFYPEYGLQLAAYRWADGIILPGDPRLYPMPEIQHTGILHLRPDVYKDTGWRLIEYGTTYMDDYIAYLGALEAYKWNQKKRFSKSTLNTVS